MMIRDAGIMQDAMIRDAGVVMREQCGMLTPMRVVSPGEGYLVAVYCGNAVEPICLTPIAWWARLSHHAWFAQMRGGGPHIYIAEVSPT